MRSYSSALLICAPWRKCSGHSNLRCSCSVESMWGSEADTVALSAIQSFLNKVVARHFTASGEMAHPIHASGEYAGGDRSFHLTLTSHITERREICGDLFLPGAGRFRIFRTGDSGFWLQV